MKPLPRISMPRNGIQPAAEPASQGEHVKVWEIRGGSRRWQ
jgi:hypothetical protein